MRKQVPVVILLLVVLIVTAVIVVATVMASPSGPQESGASQIYRITGSRDVPEASLYVSDNPMDDPTR